MCKNNIHHLDIWENFFKNNEKRYNIYIHCSDSNNINQNFVKKYLVKKFDTSWGNIYNAIQHMYKLSIKNNDYKLILVSESTIPLKSFDYIYSYLTKCNSSYISYLDRIAKNEWNKNTLLMHYGRFVNNGRNVKDFLYNVDINHWYYNETWTILNQKHASIIANDNKIINYFKKCFVYDENYPMYILSINDQLGDVVNRTTTFVNWKELSRNEENRRSPKDYMKIKPEDIRDFKNPSYLFARKFNQNSDIKFYIDNIMNNKKIMPINTMKKTLVILLSETREYELTFNNFKKNVIDKLNADLCLCIGVKKDYNYDNPFYKLAKYRYLYNEPDDFGDAFEYAYNHLKKDKLKYEKLNNINSLYAKVKKPGKSDNNIKYYGKYDNIDNFDNFNDDEIIFHTSYFNDNNWKNQLYGISKSENNNFMNQENVITYKKPLHWREFLKIKSQFMGGVKDKDNQHNGSAGILIFFRWFLLKNLIDDNLISKYDRFIITRSDFIYQLPHPDINIMNENYIWIPNCEHYGGYTDRHAILSKFNIIEYLNIFNNFVMKSNDYFMKMKNTDINTLFGGGWNLEQLIKFHLKQNNIQIKEFPYVMYTIRNKNGYTRWQKGIWNNDLGYYIKYETEYKKSIIYKKKFKKSNLKIDDFYKKYII